MYTGVNGLSLLALMSATRAVLVLPSVSAIATRAYIGGPTDHMNGAVALCGGDMNGWLGIVQAKRSRLT